MSDREVEHGSPQAGSDGPGPEEERWPVGFILTIVMVSLYLGYRLVQGAVLFVQWIF